MGKPLISIASLTLGLAAGVFLGATFFPRTEPGPAPAQGAVRRHALSPPNHATQGY